MRGSPLFGGSRLSVVSFFSSFFSVLARPELHLIGRGPPDASFGRPMLSQLAMVRILSPWTSFLPGG